MEKPIKYRRKKKEVRIDVSKKKLKRSFNRFAYKQSDLLLKTEDNLIFSPLSLYLALILLQEGARGKTKEKLVTYLGLDGSLLGFYGMVYDDFLYKNSQGRFLSNNLILVNTESFEKSFKEKLESFYQGSLYEMDFFSGNPEELVKNFIKENTSDKFDLDIDLSPNTNMILINTLDYRAAWSNKNFHLMKKSMEFKNIDKTTSFVDSFKGSLDSYYYRDDVMDGFTLDLEDGFYIKIVRDKKGDQPLNKLFSKELKRARVSFELPSFKSKSKIDMKNLLVRDGLDDIFKGGDFSFMLKEKSRVDEIIQESYLSLDEKGIEAASYSQISMVRMSIPMEEEINIVIDSPFYYGLYNRNDYLIFIGQVTSL